MIVRYLTMSELRDMFFQGLISGSALAKELKLRKKPFIFESIPLALLPEYQQNGWVEHKRFKTKVRVKKPKPINVVFEDRVWCVLADMGFDYMNSGRFFKLPYSDDYSLTQQVDVVAIDEETILIVECKAAETVNKNRSFKESIEAISGKKEGILNILKNIFPGSKRKVKFIFTTSNYVLPKSDIERLAHFDIIHFEEDEMGYYEDLTTHLGAAAKYQLLGNLFEGQKIPALDSDVPAIRGKLGPHTFYSFAIEPERLLKLGYVLHRHRANKELMPTYQRVIKKNRLRAIETFIAQGGFFPNSIIISINTKRPLQFDPANTQCENTTCRIGILHLPQKYRSAFIIDGQHRIYGYANTKYKSTNAIPVVAFENMPRAQQVDLFMQINENQKSVSKTLRNTLNANLLWDSNDLTEAIKALKLRLAQELGENKASPLCNRMIIGEHKKTPVVCITIDTIYMAFNRSNFFGSVTENSIKEIGTFYDGNVESTLKRLFDYLVLCLDYMKDNLAPDWDLGEQEGGYLTINPTVYSLIVILSDVVDHLVSTDQINPRSQPVDQLANDTKPYLDAIIRYFRELSQDEKNQLRRSYGTAGRTKYWRTLQKVIKATRADFNPEGLEQYIRDSSQRYNTQSFELIRDIETHLKHDIRQSLKSEYGEKSWWKKGVPLKVYEEAELRAVTKNREIDDPSNEVEPWDQLHLIDYREIILQNWSKLFQQKYSYPDVKGNKDEKTKWLVTLNTIRNQNFHEYSVTEEEFDFLKNIHRWLLGQ